MEIVGASTGQRRRAGACTYKRDYDRDHDRRPPPIQECGAQSQESNTCDRALVPGWLDDCELEMVIGYSSNCKLLTDLGLRLSQISLLGGNHRATKKVNLSLRRELRY